MDIEKVKALRQRTQASYAECKKALVATNQNLDQAEKFLMEKGLRMVDSIPTDKTEMGVVNSYVHPGGRIGVLVETHCKTDFVSKTEEFQQFVKEIALQVASMKPEYISRDDIKDEELIEEFERRVARLEREGNPGHLLDELAEAEMKQWFAEVCLLEQTYVRNNSKIIKELLAELINKTGEPCRIRRFVRWEIGAENGEIIMSNPDKHEEEENVEELAHDLIKKKFRTASLVFLIIVGLLVVMPFVC